MITFSALGSLTGAATTTFVTPRSKYGASDSLVRNLPEASITTSTPCSSQGTAPGEASLPKLIGVPSTVSVCASPLISRSQRPWTESNVNR